MLLTECTCSSACLSKRPLSAGVRQKQPPSLPSSLARHLLLCLPLSSRCSLYALNYQSNVCTVQKGTKETGVCLGVRTHILMRWGETATDVRWTQEEQTRKRIHRKRKGASYMPLIGALVHTHTHPRTNTHAYTHRHTHTQATNQRGTYWHALTDELSKWFYKEIKRILIYAISLCPPSTPPFSPPDNPSSLRLSLPHGPGTSVRARLIKK